MKAKETKLKKLKELVAEAKSYAMRLNPEYTMTSKNPLLWVKVPKAHVIQNIRLLDRRGLICIF